MHMHNHSNSNVNTCMCVTLRQSLSCKCSNQTFPHAACPVQIGAHHIDVYTDINYPYYFTITVTLNVTRRLEVYIYMLDRRNIVADDCMSNF